MSLSHLSIFVSGIDDPCSVDNRTWYITIYNCDGSVLEWCGKRYVVMPAKCGHLQVDVPPGCYYIKAVWGFTVVTPGLVYRANHFTDAAIVQACCNSTTCVKLFNPSAHRCGFIYVRALNDLVGQKAIAPELVNQVEGAVRQINEQVGKPARPFELGHLDEILELVTVQAKEENNKK